MTLKTLFPWFLSVGTLAGMWLIGNKNRFGWIVGLGNQALWITFIVLYAAWGLLPLSLALVLVYVRNLYRWRREEADRFERSLRAYGTHPENDWGPGPPIGQY